MQSPFYFLIETLFNLYIMVIILRFLMQLFRADFYNPLSQFIVRATNPVLIPLRKIIPGYGGIDVSSLLFSYSVTVLKFIVLIMIFSAGFPSFGSILFISLAKLINQFFSLFLYLIIIRAILSWITPGYNNPIMAVIYQLTEPLMAPVRRLIPSMGGLDLSPIVLILGLQFTLSAIESWIIFPLYQYF